MAYTKVDYPEKQCVTCGETFKPKEKRSKCCSRRCQVKHNGKSKRGPFRCNNCGVVYYTKRGAGEGERYCSRQCAFDDVHAWINVSDNGKGRERVTPYPQHSVYFPCCSACGLLFTAKHKESHLCSDECKVEYYDVVRIIKDESAHDAKTIECLYCGTEFTTSFGDRRSVYCSSKCMIRAAPSRSHRARARSFGVEYKNFNVVKTLERDRWTCQVCSCETPRSKRGSTDNNAPELDHIIPLSRGGDHVEGNTQCLCRQCNGNKGNKMPDEFYVLFNKNNTLGGV